MAEYQDAPVFGAMVALQQCVCEEITKRGLPSVCFCGVVPGQIAVHDFAEEGMAWVRMANAFPATTFPSQDLTLRNCAAPLAYQFEVGIVRCVEVDDDGEPPTVEQQFEATRLQMADMEAMRVAIQCCLPNADKILGNYTPFGPQGAVIGGWWTVYSDGLVA